MKKISFIISCLLLGLIGINYASAQVNSRNNNIWFHYYGRNKLNNKWSASFEATMRYANGFSEKQQYFVRPSIDYQITKYFMGTVGYSHYNTYVYGEPAINKINTPEDHVWIQGTFVHTSNDLRITHRLRDEFRYVGIAKLDDSGEYDIDRYDYRNRMRYLIMLNYPLIKKEDATKLFAVLGDEVFLNLGSASSSLK